MVTDGEGGRYLPWNGICLGVGISQGDAVTVGASQPKGMISKRGEKHRLVFGGSPRRWILVYVAARRPLKVWELDRWEREYGTGANNRLKATYFIKLTKSGGGEWTNSWGMSLYQICTVGFGGPLLLLFTSYDDSKPPSIGKLTQAHLYCFITFNLRSVKDPSKF